MALLLGDKLKEVKVGKLKISNFLAKYPGLAVKNRIFCPLSLMKRVEKQLTKSSILSDDEIKIYVYNPFAQPQTGPEDNGKLYPLFWTQGSLYTKGPE